MTLPAPFPPLVSGAEGLDRAPTSAPAVAARMVEVYGVPADHVLPVRGASHGLELIFRLAAREGLRVDAPDAPPFDALAKLYRPAPQDAALLAMIVRGLGSPEAVTEMADRIAPALLVVDEARVEFSDQTSAAPLTQRHEGLVVVRSLSLSHGLTGARVGALIARPATLARIVGVMEPHAVPEPSLRLALQALDPSRLVETGARIARVRDERARMTKALSREMSVEPGVGPVIAARPADLAGARAALARLGVAAEVEGDRLRLPVFARAELNDRTLAAFGLAPVGRPHRTGQSVRDTKETRIVCAVDLDAAAPVAIRTGVGFFDHMLEQVAAHGGFSLSLSCEGDLHTDPHHTIEDSAIALGQALKQALGERRGIARYGFVLPMDEAEAKVSIDLSGRPYPVFEGAFSTAFLGDYRTDMTAHVIRSLAEHLGAAIHVSVTGQDDHHKTEAVYKALGRALRQAIRVEGEAVPSTKGVL
ncbi:MAG: imidazoleglycerol-phosphate dehydratase HisB [Alphaproteobacteria bacterium]|nr:imidazoleglycerol-phosphate dehydratase HisB [Alphaproteobacteria bacterium]MBU1524871.1 imidazoleglycerol-phosphate dehydratase HisB [Alphaproteobacteria bacterium]MBU2350146.1 imidazoleglycerol-phosphate dehydratase HisB [Alphaproteobacteria bacterium]MBU2381947.1 imidazoleglycerol-phosphate dehydratase HisB [Alphaproteobacteria bacterium]